MAQNEKDASTQIDERIGELGDWRGETLSRVRGIIRSADPEIVEEWKWAKATSPGTPVWSRDGIICTGETYKSVVKLTFMKGASLDDPAKVCSTRVSRGRPAARSTSARVSRSTRPR